MTVASLGVRWSSVGVSRTTVAGAVGNVMEWYDFALFGYFAPILSELFFPGAGGGGSLLATFGVFAAGFAMRPVGAVVFGGISDRLGRRRALFLSVLMMAVPTTLLGALPTHADIGIAAAGLLIAIRLVQGLSVGGEFSGSVTYMVESAPTNRRGVAGSWANFGSLVGMLAGAGVAALMTTALPHDAVRSWGWRVPFLLGGLLGGVALWTRTSLPEPELAQHDASHQDDSPLREALTYDLPRTVRAVLFACGYGVVFYLPLVYLPTYVDRHTGMGLDAALRLNAAATALILPLIPLAAIVSDRFVRRRTLILLAFAALGAAAYPVFRLIDHGTVAAVLAGQAFFAILIAVPLGAAPAFFAEMFHTEDRATGYSLAYNVGLGVVGGTAPLVATGLIDLTGSIDAPAFYLLALAGLACGALWTITDRSRESLIRRPEVRR